MLGAERAGPWGPRATGERRLTGTLEGPRQLGGGPFSLCPFLGGQGLY